MGITLIRPKISSYINPAAETFVQEIKRNWKRVKERINKGKEKIKQREDKKRLSVDIRFGDKVYLSTKNLIEKKLDPVFIGAFLVKEIKGVVATLALPNTKIFPKFHVFLLKKAPDLSVLAKK